MDSCSGLSHATRFYFPFDHDGSHGEVGAGNWCGVLQEPRSPGWCKGHADQVRCLATTGATSTVTVSSHIPQCVDTRSKPNKLSNGLNGIPNVKLYPWVHICVPFLRLEAVCQNVWMEILLKLVTISLVSASWQWTGGLERMCCKQAPILRVRWESLIHFII